MKKLILVIWAKILGVYLVKIKIHNLIKSELAVGVNYPDKKLTQDVAVLYPHRFPNLVNTPIIKDIETRRLGSRQFSNEFRVYLDSIYHASKKLKKYLNEKK